MIASSIRSPPTLTLWETTSPPSRTSFPSACWMSLSGQKSQGFVSTIWLWSAASSPRASVSRPKRIRIGTGLMNRPVSSDTSALKPSRPEVITVNATSSIWFSVLSAIPQAR